MNDCYIQSFPDSNLLLVKASEVPRNSTVTDASGRKMDCPMLKFDGENAWFDASKLELWTPDTPVLYHFVADNIAKTIFGHCRITTQGNRSVLVNGSPFFFRGYIRGIVAHEHPNMTGEDEMTAARKNIAQAKKYGFNLVRFHSTIPSESFVRAADELGLFIHMEIGFAYDYSNGVENKTLALDNRAWRETILKYRNHPSVAIFCIGNEMHNSGHQPLVRELYETGKSLAPAKLIMDNSGWGEFDRTGADIYSQHIAYYFPYKHHKEMFNTDDCWHLNGSIFDEPMRYERDGVTVRRHANAIRPVLAHEAVHYIDIPDYEALNRKYDEFAARVGKEYLESNDIVKPRYLTEIPELVKRKGLEKRFEEFVTASQIFKMAAIKIYLEQLRLSQLCGFEMLQFSDCLKYENKNGIVDFFDDDKFIPADWMNHFNGNSALLADWSDECFFEHDRIRTAFFLSHFSACENVTGSFAVKLDGREIFRCAKLTTVSGLQKLFDVEFTAEVGKHEVTVEFDSAELKLRNQWNFWCYERIAEPKITDPQIVVTDKLDDQLFAELAAGKTVLLHYHRDNPGHTYYWPGSLDRFKPCIWDRGSNLGGTFNTPWLERTMLEHYFNLNLQPLLEGAYKLNLDTFPVPCDEWMSGVDKPVRDRMKGLVQGVKTFIDADTLRRFCYLMAIRVGNGKLVVSTVNRSSKPGAVNYHAALLRELPSITPTTSISAEELRNYLAAATKRGHDKEDIMNHFWEIDNKPVEDSLFWEENNIDLSKL